MSTLDSPALAALLRHLFAHADRDDPATFERVNVKLKAAAASAGSAPAGRADARRLHADLRRTSAGCSTSWRAPENAKLVVEFGTSFGISGIHLAAALRDAAAAASSPPSSIRSRPSGPRKFPRRGVSEVIDLRVGDAFETLKSDLGGGIDLLLLDGWKEAYLPMLRFLEPTLSPNALVVADDLDIAPEALAPYLAYVRKPGKRLRLGRDAARRSHRAIDAQLSFRIYVRLIPP
jgi:predicted O-methyltransferase YrrM